MRESSFRLRTEWHSHRRHHWQQIMQTYCDLPQGGQRPLCCSVLARRKHAKGRNENKAGKFHRSEKLEVAFLPFTPAKNTTIASQVAHMQSKTPSVQDVDGTKYIIYKYEPSPESTVESTIPKGPSLSLLIGIAFSSVRRTLGFAFAFARYLATLRSTSCSFVARFWSTARFSCRKPTRDTHWCRNRWPLQNCGHRLQGRSASHFLDCPDVVVVFHQSTRPPAMINRYCSRLPFKLRLDRKTAVVWVLSGYSHNQGDAA